MSSPSSTKQENPTRSFYDRISSAYDFIADSNERVAREKGLAALAVTAGENVLEIGYGTGHSLVELAQSVGSAGHVAGVDISPGMRDVSQKHIDQAGVSDRVTLEVAETPPLPFDDASFDVVTMSFTLELFPLDVIPTVLQEIRRVLRPEGRVGIVAMAVVPEGEHESMLESTYKWMHRHFPHIVDCQPIDARRFLTEAGFSVTHAEEMNIWTLPVAILVATL